ncbi:hypothetical protein ACHAWF_014944 [Thalassiosira exigua]
MDTSRSMNTTMNVKTGETKLSYMKKAVTSTVSTLSDEASVAVIRFGELPQLVGRPGAQTPFLWRQATAAHKRRIIDDVQALEVQGRSNWMAAFKLAFGLIANSLLDIKSTKEEACKLENIAVLFFSDGNYNMPLGVTEDDLVSKYSSGVAKVESFGDYKVHSFFYSLGDTDASQVSKKIACASSGLFAPVTSETSPFNVTSGYQSYFSTPMGTEAFQNYTSWSEIYNFSSSVDLGYTVSALVYNRDVQPPRYMGAVGMDITAEAAMKLHGGTMAETVNVMSEIISNKKLKDFNTTCEQQRINLTSCEIQSMRQMFGGTGAICLPDQLNTTEEVIEDLLIGDVDDVTVNITGSNTTTNITGDQLLGDKEEETLNDDERNEVLFEDVLNCTESFLKPCPGYDEYPDDLWNNVNHQRKEFEDRVCCEVGIGTVSDECPKLDEVRDTKLSDAAIFAIMFGSLAIVEIIGCYFCFFFRKRRNAQ